MAWQERAYNRNEGTPPMRFSLPPMSRLSIALIAVCLAIFVLQSLTGATAGKSWLVEWGKLTFVGKAAIFQPWRWITYQYLHASGSHIFFNCLGIFFFIPPLERRWGWQRTLGFYTLGGIFAGLIFGMLAILSPGSSLIGASGSILAALGACALLFPEIQLILLVFPVPIRVAAGLFAVMYLLTIMGDRNSGLSDAAHLGGLAFGFLAPLLGGPVWNRFMRRWHVRRLRHQTQADEDEQASVDRILEKVHDHGMHSLNWRERRILRHATEHQRQRDFAVPKRR